MDSTTIEHLPEIAGRMDAGFRACVHKTTGQVLFVPNPEYMLYIDMSVWREERKLMEDALSGYREIEKWTPREAHRMRGDFAEQLTKNEELQDKLFLALAKKKPFREFKFVIDGSGIYRQQWFDFKNKWQQDYIKQQLSTLMQADE